MKTAVQWLYENLLLEPMYNEDVIYNEDVLEMAKEMERQQIIKARLDIYTTGDLSAEEYYNEKFKSE